MHFKLNSMIPLASKSWTAPAYVAQALRPADEHQQRRTLSELGLLDGARLMLLGSSAAELQVRNSHPPHANSAGGRRFMR